MLLEILKPDLSEDWVLVGDNLEFLELRVLRRYRNS